MKIFEYLNIFEYSSRTATAAVIEPATRLRDWLSKRAEPPPEFKIKKINLTTLRKAVKKMKGKRVHGRDEINSYSLKTISPTDRGLSSTLSKPLNSEPKLCSPMETTIDPTLSQEERENKS